MVSSQPQQTHIYHSMSEAVNEAEQPAQPPMAEQSSNKQLVVRWTGKKLKELTHTPHRKNRLEKREKEENHSHEPRKIRQRTKKKRK